MSTTKIYVKNRENAFAFQSLVANSIIDNNLTNILGAGRGRDKRADGGKYYVELDFACADRYIVNGEFAHLQNI